jgi:hypothetical protein
MARPSKYNPDIVIPIAQALAREGLIDPQISTALDVSRSTLNRWKKEFPEFRDALKESKALADSKVENMLYKKATGDIKITKTRIETVSGNPVKDPQTGKMVPTQKQRRCVETTTLVPDTTSQIFWLKNRRPDRWRDKQEIMVKERNPIYDMTDEELEAELARIKANELKK